MAFASAAIALAKVDDDHTITDPIGRTYLAPNAFSPVVPQSFSIGTAPTSGFALDVHGELMTPALGDVFKTDAIVNKDSYWRMFHAGTEFGNLFHRSHDADDKFNVNATVGHLTFLTNSIERMRINPTRTYPTLGAFNNIVADGFAGICPNTSLWTNARGPFSRLHLADGNLDWQASGYRPWQRNGISLTGNNDQMYMGQKYGDQDYTDAVIQWSDNPGVTKADRMRFLFTSNYTGAATGMNSLEGLEAMRMWPTFTDGVFVGVGDWFGLGANGDPQERLDLLDRTIRLRSFVDPLLYRNNSYDRVLVANPADGRVYWRDANTLGGCDWLVDPPTQNIFTAYGSGTCPPDIFRGVGIGVDPAIMQPKAKLEVLLPELIGTPVPATTLDGFTGVRSQVFKLSTAANGLGMDAFAGTFSALAGTGWMTGVRAKASNGNYSIGVDASGQIPNGSTGMATDAIGVKGIGTANNNANRVIGVYGNGTGAAGANSWAFWSDGNTFSLGGALWVPSDEELKQNIEDVTEASSMLAELTPKSYEFNAAQYPFMSFNTGRHFGIMAQNLAQVLPEAVRDVTRPAEVDSVGNIVVPAATFKAVNYEALVPLLIASNKEQQARMNAQEARLSQLEDELAACCADGGSRAMVTKNTGGRPNFDAIEVKQERLLISPNPFTDHTTLRYYVPQTGRVSLQVTSSEGRPVGTLREEQADAGSFTYEWNTQSLASGTYFVALIVDGNVVVKKAVKVGER